MTVKKLAPIIVMSLGVLTLAAVIVPLSISVVKASLFTTPVLIDPTNVSSAQTPVVINDLGITTTIDYASPNAWFDTPQTSLVEDNAPISSGVQYYTISIPRLNLENVPIEINGTDLKKNAIHFPHTALPGTPGNAVIFGHSALPQFYQKGNPLTIFNALPDARVGDEIIVKYDGITYRYQVKKTQEVTPSQIDVISQRYDKHEMTLVTCVPLGTYWHRFVATAELVN